ncbi:uncharacterized protein PHALS_06877 [Plasmopara halstedii]|uniref:Uncharacterized protein n=1 Tax=Plasmopara halstedii TaxID=4781 RepID=A0A0N7L875_PLAHL|nr:uncharacterized protein PHALS_06877 [Plasmopara halstedii]CEG49091.1 hypothetical protein PHALS_06877 [Plasmopara halstedii]|eukprot:XP_024585460.1 hypothetical protein PHALS_06877 [Plasmopara halstedii]
MELVKRIDFVEDGTRAACPDLHPTYIPLDEKRAELSTRAPEKLSVLLLY